MNTLLLLCILAGIVALSEWLNQRTLLNYLGTSFLVIIISSIAVNVGVLPPASDENVLYDIVLEYIAPLSIFYLLLGVNFKAIKQAGLPMLVMFLVGAIGTTIGAILAIKLVGGGQVFGEDYKAMAGMMTGSYTGGSVNFNAIALHYDMAKNGSLYAGIVAVDYIVTIVWLLLSIVLPKVLQIWFPRKQVAPLEQPQRTSSQEEDAEWISPKQLSMLIVLGTLMLWSSNWTAEWFKGLGFGIPSILILTTIALILAQFQFIQRLQGDKVLGLFLINLFLVVIGAYCELAALYEVGALVGSLFVFMLSIVTVHTIIIYLIGGIFKQDWMLVSVASQSNIGGPSTAIALAKSLNRDDLFLPAILVGSLGAGIGTYLGFFVAEIIL